MFRSILNQVRKPLELSTLASGFCTRSPILRRIRGNKKISHSKKNVTVCESIFKKLGWIKKNSSSLHRNFDSPKILSVSFILYNDNYILFFWPVLTIIEVMFKIRNKRVKYSHSFAEINDVKIVGTLISDSFTLQSGTKALTIRTRDSPTRQ